MTLESDVIKQWPHSELVYVSVIRPLWQHLLCSTAHSRTHRILYFVGFSFVYLCFSCICHVFVSLWCFCQLVVILCVTVIECMSDSAGFYLSSCCYIFLDLPAHLWSCSVSVFVLSLCSFSPFSSLPVSILCVFSLSILALFACFRSFHALCVTVCWCSRVMSSSSVCVCVNRLTNADFK